MRFLSKYFFSFIIVFNLISCQPSIHFSSNPINDSYLNHSQSDSLINPYKTKLDAEMNEVLVISAEEFPKVSGKPETKLGNLVADLSFEIAKRYYKDSIDFCLLNFGGLRTSLPKGEITRGKVFELMPFENELVVVSVSNSLIDSITNYLETTPQPIAGDIHIAFGSPFVNIAGKFTTRKEVKILTTDYLAKGGDNMTFFANPIKYEEVGIKLRDAIIEYCTEQNKQGKQLTGKLDGRITFE